MTSSLPSQRSLDRYDTYMGHGPGKVVHWEHWSNPDAATAITGIDFYAHPRTCMRRLNAMYPALGLPEPASDDPLPRIADQVGRDRWGHELREAWQQDRARERFPSREAMLAFSPPAHGDFVICHDDIVTTKRPICSPRWMRSHIFPWYEEFWSILRAAGKQVIFMVDGCVDAFVDDVMACGARGIISEPFTDYKAIARRYDNPFLAGEGDCRVLMRNNPDGISAMVDRMVETARMSGGTMMCIGNHIPFNVPSEAIKLYLDLAHERAWRL